MDDTLILHVPTKDELWFRRDMLHSPEAMSYNANWDVSFPGYHRDTGCIDFPPSSEEPWFRDWIGQEPERYFAMFKEPQMEPSSATLPSTIRPMRTGGIWRF